MFFFSKGVDPGTRSWIKFKNIQIMTIQTIHCTYAFGRRFHSQKRTCQAKLHIQCGNQTHDLGWISWLSSRNSTCH